MKPMALLAICASMAACAPLPAGRYFAPEVSGVVLDNGRPLADARVRLSSQLTNEIQSSTTDAQGRFTVGPLTNFQFVVKQFGVAYYRYTVQVVRAGRALEPYVADGPGDTPRKLELRCEFVAAPLPGASPGQCAPAR
jgi:hypothetical protein